MPDYSAGTAYLSVAASLAGAKDELKRQVDEAAAGVTAKVGVKVDDAQVAAAKAKVAEIAAEVEAANQRQTTSTRELASAESDLDALRNNTRPSEAVAAAEQKVTSARSASQLAAMNLTAAENYAGTTEDTLAQRREAVTRTTQASAAAESELTRVKAATAPTDAEISAGEARVASAREASSRAAEDARGASTRLGSAQSTLKKATDDAAKAAEDSGNKTDTFSKKIDKLGSSTDKTAGSVLGFTKSLLTNTATYGGMTFGILGLAQGALSLTSALLPAAGALGLMPALGIAGAAAIGTLKIGTQNFGAAIKDIGTPKFAADLAKLAPSAQDAARGIASLKPAYDSLQLAVQQQLFLGLGGTIRSLGTDYLPMARTGFVGMAAGMNQAVQQVGGFLKAPATIAMLRTTTDNVVLGFHNFAGALEPVIQGLTGVGAVGSSFLPQLGSEVTSVAQKFGAWLDRMNASGQMWQWINTGLSVLRSLGELIANVGDILMKVLSASASAGSNMLSVLVQLTGGAKNFLDSAQGMAFLKTIFDNIHTALMALQPLIDAVGNGLKEVLPPVTAALGDVGRALGSLAPSIPLVVTAIKQLAPVAGQAAGVIAGALNGSVRALGPIVGVAAGALSAIMPFLKDIAPVVGPAALAIYALIKATQGISTAVEAFKDFKKALLGFEIVQQITKWVQEFSLAETIASVQAKLLAISEGIAAAAGYVFGAAVAVVDALMDANPIALLVLAIVGLIAVVVLIITHFQQFKDIVSTVWNFISSTTMAVWNAISAFIVAVVTSIGAFFTTQWNQIAAFFTGIWNGIRGVVMTVWNAIAAYLTAMFQVHYALWMQIWNAISGFFIGIWDAIRNTAVTVWNAISGFFVGAFNAFVAFFQMIWNNISSFFVMIWNGIKDQAITLWNAIVAFFTPAINAFSAFWSMIWNGISSFFSMIWNGIKAQAIALWNAIVAFFTPAINAFSAFWSSVWNGISSFFSMIWNGIKLEATTLWNDIASFFTGAFNAFSSFFGGVWNGIAGMFHNIWQGISNDAGAIWNGIVAVVKGAVNGVIDAANWMVGGVNKVLSFLLIPTIPNIPRLEAGGTVSGEPQMLASGGRVGGGFKTNGPTAIVGEGNPAHPEYVIPTDPKYRTRATALHAAAGAQLGVPMMADGGILGGIGSAISTAGSWLGNAASSVGSAASSAFGAVSGALGDVGQWIGSGFDALMNSAKNAMGSMIPKGLFSGIGNFFVDKMFPAIQAKITAAQAASSAGGAFVGPGGAAPAGAIGAWIAQALAILGYPQNYALGIAEQIHSESGGNPNAIQGNIGDVNNASGDLAKGIMQVISTTFASNALPGHGNIFNPVDNIIAGSRYAMAKYGASWFEPGPSHNHGYATGGVIGLPAQSFDIPVGSTGMLPPGLSLTYNGTGSAEPLTRMDTSGITGSSSMPLAGMQIQGTLELDPTMTTGFVDARVSGGLSAVAAGLNNGPRG